MNMDMLDLSLFFSFSGQIRKKVKSKQTKLMLITTHYHSLPPVVSSRYNMKKQEAGVKLKMQDLRLLTSFLKAIRAGYSIFPTLR